MTFPLPPMWQAPKRERIPLPRFPWREFSWLGCGYAVVALFFYLLAELTAEQIVTWLCGG